MASWRVGQALEHPYMAELHDPEDEPECDAEFDFDYEKKVRGHARPTWLGTGPRRLVSWVLGLGDQGEAKELGEEQARRSRSRPCC